MRPNIYIISAYKLKSCNKLRVQWSNGYDFCLTFVMTTEGSRFDPGLNHFLRVKVVKACALFGATCLSNRFIKPFDEAI